MLGNAYSFVRNATRRGIGLPIRENPRANAARQQTRKARRIRWKPAHATLSRIRSQGAICYRFPKRGGQIGNLQTRQQAVYATEPERSGTEHAFIHIGNFGCKRHNGSFWEQRSSRGRERFGFVAPYASRMPEEQRPAEIGGFTVSGSTTTTSCTPLRKRI